MSSKWSRREFVGAAAGAGTFHSLAPGRAWALAAQDQLPPPRSQASSPEITSGRVVPLLESNVARPLRYTPREGGFFVRNGSEFFNRPLYGPNIPFRVDGGDLPEFSLYLPGHGGNLRLGVARDGRSLWLSECASVQTSSLEGRLRYEVRDPLLGASGTLTIEALTYGAGLWVEISGVGLAPNVDLLWAFGGVSGRKGKRNGDIGCEDEPVSRFFQLRPAECKDNTWALTAGTASAEVESGKMRLRTLWPAGSELKLSDAGLWNKGWQAMWSAAAQAPALPLLVGRVSVPSQPLHLAVEVLAGAQLAPADGEVRAMPTTETFAQRRKDLSAVAQGVRWTTPDPFLDSMAGALGIAADAIWDEAQGCVMHGGVAWRMPLAGWRGPYALDATGRHDRMRRHVRHWLAKQNQSAVTNGSGGQLTATGFTGIEEAKGAPDPGSHNSRTENLLHSNGDLSHNHYDMNLVFFDAVLRHLRWTGDLEFAREVWPALERHAAWERRLFRRDYGTPEQTLPLYEAYAAIWASDNLQYNGGGAAHSSAYNVFLNRCMAALAEKLGKPTEAVAYRAEAEAIAHAMRQVLWMSDRGAFAESRDWLGERSLAESPAVWTVYHTIDSEVATPQEAWQMAAERLRNLRRIPVRGTGVPDDAGWQLACSDWQPYVWSLTLLVTAEMLHTALALYQAGMAEDAFGLLRGTLLDAGFRGLCPGNFPMSLQLDPHRQESQRDFGDPTGCAARALLEGLWGVLPDRLQDKLRLRPQLPLAWQKAELQHPELTLSFSRDTTRDTWRIQSRFNTPLRLSLELRALTVDLPRVHVNGQPVRSTFVEDAIGEPRLLVEAAEPAASWAVDIEWRGAKPVEAPTQPLACVVGQPIRWPAGVQVGQLDDPQSCLSRGLPLHAGGHTVFALQKHAACAYWLPLELSIAEPAAIPSRAASSGRFEPLPLDTFFSGHVRDILTRPHERPRPGLCSLNLPDGLLGGWANFDGTASVTDEGLRRAGGTLQIPGGLHFLTPSGDAPNCVFVSRWEGDRTRLQLPARGRARAIHLLLAGTTFPQATHSPHAAIVLQYADGTRSRTHQLRSPNDWWPVEQDYLLDDYVFRLSSSKEPGVETLWRVDLRTGTPRTLPTTNHRGGAIRGGAAFIVRIEADGAKELQAIELQTLLYGPVLGLLGATLEIE